MNAYKQDGGAFISTEYCSAKSIIAGETATDNVAITGVEIDRTGYDWAKFVVAWTTTVAENKSLKIAAGYQESDTTTTGYETEVALQATTIVKTGGTGGGTYTGTTEFDIPLTNKKQFMKFNFTPDLTATSTDTAHLAGVVLLGGCTDNPCTKSTYSEFD